MNNIAQYFVSAWLNKDVKHYLAKDNYLDLMLNSNDSVWAMNDKGKPKTEHSYWAGFAKRTAKGLHFESRLKGQ